MIGGKWLWRIVLFIITVFIIIGVYRVATGGVGQYLFVRVPEFIEKPIVEMQDPVSGLVTVQHQINLESILERVANRLNPDDFPLEMKLCLQDAGSFYKQAIDCDVITVESQEESISLASFRTAEESYYLPNTGVSFSLETLFQIQSGGSDPLSFVSNMQTIRWTPSVGLRLIDGTRLFSGDVIENQDLVMVFSRWNAVNIDLTLGTIKAEMILDPDPIESFLLAEEFEPSYTHWLVSLPQELDQQDSPRLCLELPPSFLDCFEIVRSLRAAAPILENSEEVKSEVIDSEVAQTRGEVTSEEMRSPSKLVDVKEGSEEGKSEGEKSEVVKERESEETDSSSIDVLDLKWLGTENTMIDVSARIALDHSQKGKEFETILRVQSSFPEELQVFVVVDGLVTFTNTISEEHQDDLIVRMNPLEYGKHRLLVYAVFPDGQRTADVVFPFSYEKARFAAIGSKRFELWQILGIGVLLFLGALYLGVRVFTITGRMKK